MKVYNKLVRDKIPEIIEADGKMCKTRLVRLFAEAIGATSQNGRYKLVSVRPDWSDSSARGKYGVVRMPENLYIIGRFHY